MVFNKKIHVKIYLRNYGNFEISKNILAFTFKMLKFLDLKNLA